MAQGYTNKHSFARDVTGRKNTVVHSKMGEGKANFRFLDRLSMAGSA